MITVRVPTFDESNGYTFVGEALVKIKNKPDLTDLRKITRLLPGICQGSVGERPLSDLLRDGRKSVRSFYDARQNTRHLARRFVEVVR